jgi:catechol 2,3-dioxygenase-like lactoylglutathione lyase family enzyme
MDIEAKNAFLREHSSTRPAVAVGHVTVGVTDVAAGTMFFEALGLRWVHQTDRYSVLELRGGTHLVLGTADEPAAPGTPAPFDIMVDDVESTRADYEKRGLQVSEVNRGSIHTSFRVAGPDGYEIRITSPHTGGRAV